MKDQWEFGWIRKSEPAAFGREGEVALGEYHSPVWSKFVSVEFAVGIWGMSPPHPGRHADRD
jgi:hypothetical protein